jgi:hypothetical protein
MVRIVRRVQSLDPGICAKPCKKGERLPFQLVQPSLTVSAELGERHAERTNRTKARGVPSIEQYSVRIPEDSTEESSQ